MRLHAIILFVSCLAACTTVSGNQPSACRQDAIQPSQQRAGFSVGLHHPPMPSGIEDLGGFLVHEKGQETDLAIEYVRDSKGTVIWLDQIIYQDRCPDPEYVILDFRRIPSLASNERLENNCRPGDVSGGGDGVTVAVAADENNEVLRHIRLAWRIDVKTRKLVDISPVEIQCINEGFLERE